MHPELRAYLDGYNVRTMVHYDTMDRKLALMSKILAGVSTPQPACSMGMAADDGLTDDASVSVVIPDVFSATTQAQEPPAISRDAPSICIEMVLVTCSTECLTKVASIASVEEVQYTATTAHPEPVVDLIHQEVAAKIVTLVATTTDVEPKTSVQALDNSPLSVNTFPPAPSELDHGIIIVVSSNLTTWALSRCSTECPVPTGVWVSPLTTTIDSADETHDTIIAERLLPPSFNHQPWPPPVQVQFNHMGPLFRPSLWSSFRPLSVTSYLEEPSSRIHSQSHGGPCFSPSLIRLMIRDVPREDPSNGTDSDRTCTNGIQHKLPESISTIGLLAVAHSIEREDCLQEYQDASSFLHQSDLEDGVAIARESEFL